MKISTFKYYAFVLMIVNCVKTIQAQPTIGVDYAKRLVEKTVLFTDRETYCVDEDISFSAFNVTLPMLRNADWSNILYVELIAPDGEAFARRKFAFSQDGATGTLRIPTNMLTGNYYLRAYTRWMRDFSPYNYFYKMVSVINPFRGELLEPRGNPGKGSVIESPTINSDDFQLKTSKKSYTKREQVSLKVSVDHADDYNGKFVVSVIPKGIEEPLMPNLAGFPGQKFSPDFIPETRGLSISGKVVNQADSAPMPFTLVGLTIFKENPENMNVLTNENGQFFFDLSKLKGEYEIFISAKSNEKQIPMILVDNDFSSQKIELPYVQFDLSEASKMRYQSLAFNSQMQTLYKQQKIEDELKSFSSDSSFYGKPDFVLNISKYIAMPSVKDYIYELIPQVGVRHDEKKTILKVLGTYSDLAMYEPLVLVDMVPIFDIDRVLELQPDKIERIEVVTVPYVRGDIIFGGIVSLFSKKGDLAGIDLPSIGRFITYSMLSRDFTQVAPDPKNNHIPDLRNCLYWNPNLKLKGTRPSEISFNTGDNGGDYVIVVRGVDQSGKTKISTAEFSVK
ncbi:MAG TPA: hypothetical protein VGK38_04385 [Prolixibacteraceae bacterium]